MTAIRRLTWRTTAGHADEEHGNAELRLQVCQEIDHLRLDGHIERGNRLIADEKVWPGDQSARQDHALALSTESSWGKRFVTLAESPTACSSSPTRASRSDAVPIA